MSPLYILLFLGYVLVFIIYIQQINYMIKQVKKALPESHFHLSTLEYMWKVFLGLIPIVNLLYVILFTIYRDMLAQMWKDEAQASIMME